MNDLGLDISSSKIGFAVVSNNEIKEIKFQETLFLDNKIRLEERAEEFKKIISHIKNSFQIENIYIEEPLISARNQNTVSILQRFNGMCSFIVYDMFGKLPIMINVRSARKVLGIKITKDIKKEKEKKQVIIDYIENYFKNSKTPFVYEITKFGNPAKGCDDLADALVLCLAASKLLKK